MPKTKSIGISCNIYTPGTAIYYRDQLVTIVAVGGDYDGYDPNSAKQMRGLVDELVAMAQQALDHKKLYIMPNITPDSGVVKRKKKAPTL